MRYKVAPTPVDRELLAATREAVPRDPRSTEDCCGRIQRRTDLPTRDAAESWLVFLDALGLATRTDSGYQRTPGEFDLDDLATPFRERVWGVEELLTGLAYADGPVTAPEAFDGMRQAVPEWERKRHDDWQATWRERVGTLLEWAVLFDLAERDADGYTT